MAPLNLQLACMLIACSCCLAALPIHPAGVQTSASWLLQVAGNFHFAPGKSFSANGMHVHDLVPFQDKNFDLSHTIKTLAFGKEYPGMNNPLDGVSVNQSLAGSSMGQTGMWQYFLKVTHLLLLLAWAFTILQVYTPACLRLTLDHACCSTHCRLWRSSRSPGQKPGNGCCADIMEPARRVWPEQADAAAARRP